MKGEIILYKQSSQSKSRQLSRALHGYVDKSNYGKYTYEREGLLNEIPYRKLIKGAFVLRKEDSNRLIELLERYDAKYYVREIKLTKKDMARLEIS